MTDHASIKSGSCRNSWLHERLSFVLQKNLELDTSISRPVQLTHGLSIHIKKQAKPGQIQYATIAGTENGLLLVCNLGKASPASNTTTTTPILTAKAGQNASRRLNKRVIHRKWSRISNLRMHHRRPSYLPCSQRRLYHVFFKNRSDRLKVVLQNLAKYLQQTGTMVEYRWHDLHAKERLEAQQQLKREKRKAKKARQKNRVEQNEDAETG